MVQNLKVRIATVFAELLRTSGDESAASTSNSGAIPRDPEAFDPIDLNVEIAGLGFQLNRAGPVPQDAVLHVTVGTGIESTKPNRDKGIVKRFFSPTFLFSRGTGPAHSGQGLPGAAKC